LKLENILYKLNKKGIYTVDSLFPNVTYCFHKNNIIIMSRNHGTFNFGLDQADEFINELSEITQMAKERKKEGKK